MLRKLLYKIILLIFIINLVILNNDYRVYAKEQINFKNITIDDGLVQGTVETLFQDSKGYIWIGTNDGLCRYNGYKFKVYSQDGNKEKSLVNNYILDIKEDNDGNIWVGTIGGISKINKDGVVVKNYLDKSDNGNLSNLNINTILITKNNKILVGTPDGLNIYDKNTDSFKRILNDSRLDDQYIETLAEDGKGNMWLGTETGLRKIDLNLETVQNYILDNEEEIEIYKVYYDEKGYIWAGSIDKGAYKINLETNEITQYKKDVNDNTSLSGNFIKNFLRDSYGNLWVATEEGLSKYIESSDNFITFKNKIYDTNTIVNNNIYSLIEDKTGLVWIGTYAGISIFNPNSQIHHYKNDPFDEATISSNMISAFYEDDEGYTWVGNRGNGIDILNREKDRILTINTSNYSDILPSNDIFDIIGIKDDIYIATSKGIVLIDKKEKKYNKLDNINQISSSTIRRLYYDDLGYLWIGTTNGCLILDLETKEVIDITYIIEKYAINDKYIENIFKDSDGEYWIGTFVQGGLIRINPKTNKVYGYKNKEDDDEYISDNSIRCIAEDDDGNIFIGTNFGINIFNKESGKFRRINTSDGMANNTVYGILIDSYGNPWCSTNMGISKVDLKTNTIVNLDVTDGLQSNEFNGNAYYKNEEGEFLFGGINGFNIINPENIKKDNKTYDIVFDEININGVKSNKFNLMKLDYYQNNISISAFLPNYKNSKSIQYYYYLEGGNNNRWMLMDTNSITLSNLSTGKYTFKMKARSNEGVVSNESQIEFAIKPPFWASKYAWILYVVAIVLYILHNIRKVKILDNMVELRTKALSEEMKRNKELFDKVIKLEKSKNSYLINLSHELRTPLNVIYSTEQLIRELNKNKGGIDKSKLDDYMKIMKNNTKRLLKIINDLIDTSKIEHGSYNLEIKEIDIVYVVEEAALSLRKYIEEKGIELIVDPEIEEKVIEADENEIERCIVNIVGNASKFTQAGGYIKVVIKELEEKVAIEISDNGIGIDKKNHKLIFNRFNQVVDPTAEVKKGSGLGLTITKKIIDLHKGEIYVESEVGKGSKFVIILPVKQ